MKGKDMNHLKWTTAAIAALALGPSIASATDVRVALEGYTVGAQVMEVEINDMEVGEGGAVINRQSVFSVTAPSGANDRIRVDAEVYAGAYQDMEVEMNGVRVGRDALLLNEQTVGAATLY